MIIQNPILKGFYPDPSVCKANNKYYMVCSSFQYFPGVPLFESEDLVNWKQIGHCLTRPSQVNLEAVNSSGGVFAPTIRFYKGIFYMTTTNDTTRENFYVWTDDIYGDWSEPIPVDQGGIDPSLYFEDDRAYFMSNGADDAGVPGIVQCEIDIKTGKKLSKSTTIWQGSGGRYLESPHLYKFENGYYLMAAEGGTEYGHMVTYARGQSIWGPFEGYAKNPVLTNRNLGGFEIQGVGHGDLIEAPDGNFYMLHLGFRQTGQYSTYHHLGREAFITPITFHEDGWFTAGDDGTTKVEYNIPHLREPQKQLPSETFENTNWAIDWCHMRFPKTENYLKKADELILKGSKVTLDHVASPSFLGLRQKDFNAIITCHIEIDFGEAGLTLYMDENHHYDLALRKTEDYYEVVERLCIGNIKSIEACYKLGKSGSATLLIESDPQTYKFYLLSQDDKILLGQGLTRYLSSEVAGGFTGVLIGLYATSKEASNTSKFTNFTVDYI